MKETIELNNGFLDDNLNFEVNRIRKENLEAYQLVEELNKLLYEIEQSFIKENASKDELYVYTTFNQIHISCQTYIILIERGLYGDSQIILRAIYEKIFNLKMVMLDGGYLKRILKDSLNQSCSTLKKMKSDKIFELLEEDIVDNRINEFEKVINNMSEIKETMNLSDIADKVGMRRQYIYYKLLCEYAHNDLAVLMQNLKFEEEGVIIKGGQTYGEILDEILKFVECVEYTIRAISDYLNVNSFVKKLENLQLKYEYLWKDKYKK